MSISSFMFLYKYLYFNLVPENVGGNLQANSGKTPKANLLDFKYIKYTVSIFANW